MIVAMNTSGQQTTATIREAKAAEIKSRHGKCTIVLYLDGDTYKAYGESASQIKKVVPVTMQRENGIWETEFAKRCEDTYFPKFIRERYKICIVNE